jgi:hypothetical protein
MSYPYHWYELSISLIRAIRIIGMSYLYHWYELFIPVVLGIEIMVIRCYQWGASASFLTTNDMNKHEWTRSLKGQLSVFICVHPWLNQFSNHGWTPMNTDKGQLNKALNP